MEVRNQTVAVLVIWVSFSTVSAGGCVDGFSLLFCWEKFERSGEQWRSMTIYSTKSIELLPFEICELRVEIR